MKPLLLISLVSLLFFSCKGYYGPVTSKDDYTKGSFTVQNKYFSTIGEEHIFRANIQVFKKELSGLLVVKRIDEQLHRIVLTSDFGNTLFDFSIYKTDYKTNYVMPDLDKKIILNFLAKDFGYLVEENYVMSAKARQDKGTIYSGTYKKKKAFVIVDQDGEVREVIAANARKPKVLFTYPQEETGTVEIQHKNFPLEIRLTPLTK